MTKTHLEIGCPRIGSLVDYDERTPEVFVMLEKCTSGIKLSIPWICDASKDVYERWFDGYGTHRADDPSRTKYQYEVPARLFYSDSGMSAQLLDCHSSGYKTNFVHGTGSVAIGKIVYGAPPKIDFSKINGMRTWIQGLSDWISLKYKNETVVTDDEGRVQSIAITLSRIDPLSIRRRPKTDIKVNWAVSGPLSEISENVCIETRLQKEREWHYFVALHSYLRSLVSVSYWTKANMRHTEVMRLNDRDLQRRKNPSGEIWRAVDEADSTTTSKFEKRNNFIAFEDIGIPGIRKWFWLSKHYRRFVDPLVSQILFEGMPLESSFMQLGVAFESLGYLLMLADNKSHRAAKNKKFRQRLIRICADMPKAFFFDLSKWATDYSEMYNTLKHIDKGEYDIDSCIKLYYQAIAVARYWVALRLGSSQKNLNRRAKMDKHFGIVLTNFTD
jgi:hypothetical protein